MKKVKKKLDTYGPLYVYLGMKSERNIKVMEKKFDKLGVALKFLGKNLVEKYGNLITDEEMRKRFADGLTIKKGRKFMKIISGTSVWGFVALGNGTHKNIPYVKGDTFKPASWASPAKHVRGNILDGTTNWYDWTGPNYLK